MGRNVRAKNAPFASKPSSLAGLDPYGRAQEALKSKNTAAAIVLFRQAIVLQPNHYGAYYNLGLALAGQGDLIGAIAATRRAIELQPRNLQPRVNLADLFRMCLKFKDAFDVCQQALAIDPKFADIYTVRGTTRKEAGDLDGAIEDLQTSIALKRNSAFAHRALGSMLSLKGRLPEAMQSFEKSRRLNPDDAELLRLLGDLYMAEGNVRQAFIDYRRSIELAPYDAHTHANLAGLLCKTGQFDLAVMVGSMATKLDPNNHAAHANLATAYEVLGKTDESIAAYAEALRCKPDEGKVLMSMCRLLRQDCDWEGLGVSEALAQSLTYKKGIAISSFGILNVTSSLADILQCGRLWGLQQTKECGAPLSTYKPRPEHRRGEKLRIGYLSADFHVHATAALIAEVFELHDKSRFETFGYSIGGQDDSPMRRRLVSALDHFVELNKLTHAAAAERIRADDIDILVDLKGYTFQARVEILGWRPAPIQVNFLGYPGTMGVPFMDYILADPVVAPMDQQRLYSEKIVQLPDSYQPNDRQRTISSDGPTRADCGLPEDGFVFCCFNASHKLHESLFSVWMRLLHANPKSVLWLLSKSERIAVNLGREAEKHGIDPARLVYAPRLPVADHLARMALGDLFLDTSPYGAHTTASEALWTGLPMVTYLGEAFPARVGASLLTAIGLPELITRSLEEYEALACRLAQNKDEMTEIRAKLAQKIQTAPLFDSPRFTRHLETAYARMAEIRDAGEAPIPFAVQSS